MDEMKKNNDLMSGKGEGGKWITVNGSHIFIEDGQSVDEAMEKHFSKSGDTKTNDLVKKYQSAVDHAIKTYGRVGGGLYEELDNNGLYIDENGDNFTVKSKTAKTVDDGNKSAKNAPKKELSTTQQIKSKLKEAGIDTKNVSIRQSRGTYSSAYYVTVKSPYIDLETVKKKCNDFESYERDQRTGEILEGGNTFVFASYDDDAFNDVIKEHIPQAQKFLNDAKNLQDGYGVSIQDGASLFKDGSSYQLFNDTKNGGAYTTRIYDEKQLAKFLFQLKQFKKIIY